MLLGRQVQSGRVRKISPPIPITEKGACLGREWKKMWVFAPCCWNIRKEAFFIAYCIGAVIKILRVTTLDLRVQCTMCHVSRNTLVCAVTRVGVWNRDTDIAGFVSFTRGH
jgi:hypothetical protein